MTTLTRDPQAQATGGQTLRDSVETAMTNYFAHLDGHKPANLYELVLEEIEIPLLRAVMKFTRNNQSEAARIMGLSRGTLRKKLKQYQLD